MRNGTKLLEPEKAETETKSWKFRARRAKRSFVTYAKSCRIDAQLKRGGTTVFASVRFVLCESETRRRGQDAKKHRISFGMKKPFFLSRSLKPTKDKVTASGGATHNLKNIQRRSRQLDLTHLSTSDGIYIKMQKKNKKKTAKRPQNSFKTPETLINI